MSLIPTPLFRELASIIDAYNRCRKDGNEFATKHAESINQLIGFLPSGSGIDNGLHIDIDASSGERLVFRFSFHHMAENGMYDGWTEHVLTVKPSLQFGFVLHISGRNRNDVKEYLCDIFQHAFSSKVWQSAEAPHDWHCDIYEPITA